MNSLVNTVALFQAADGLIRKLIFDRVLQPGQRIDEQALARDFGISRTPLREALKVLHSEGLVKLVPRRGCFVAKLTEHDVDQIYEMIGLLEGACAARAAVLATAADIARLQRITHRMAQMAGQRNYKRYFDANVAAHETVQEIAGNPWQKNIIQYLRSMCRLYPYVAVGKISGRLEESLAEHHELLAAIEAHDPARAEEVMRRHIVHTRAALRQIAAG